MSLAVLYILQQYSNSSLLNLVLASSLLPKQRSISARDLLSLCPLPLLGYFEAAISVVAAHNNDSSSFKVI